MCRAHTVISAVGTDKRAPVSSRHTDNHRNPETERSGNWGSYCRFEKVVVVVVFRESKNLVCEGRASAALAPQNY